jgi:hypothetical protein
MTNKIFYYIMNFFYASNNESNRLIGEINSLPSTSKTFNISEEKNIKKNEIIFQYTLGNFNDFKKNIIVKEEPKDLNKDKIIIVNEKPKSFKKHKEKIIVKEEIKDLNKHKNKTIFNFKKNIIVKEEIKDLKKNEIIFQYTLSDVNYFNNIKN